MRASAVTSSLRRERARELVDGGDLDLRDVAQLVADAAGERAERRAPLGEQQLRARLLELLLDRRLRRAQLVLGVAAARDLGLLVGEQLAHLADVARDEHDALAASPLASSTGEPVTETGMRSPSLVTSHDSSRRSTSPSSMRRRTTVRRPELLVDQELRDRHAAQLVARVAR